MNQTQVQPTTTTSAASWESYGCGAAAAAAESASRVAEHAIRDAARTLDTVTRRGPKGTPVGERMTEAERRTVRMAIPSLGAATDLQLAAARACGVSLGKVQ